MMEINYYYTVKPLQSDIGKNLRLNHKGSCMRNVASYLRHYAGT